MRVCRYASLLVQILIVTLGNSYAIPSAVTSALQSLQALDSRYFIAGGTCAAFSHGITTPIDVVKTRIQANPDKYNSGMTNATLIILKEEGPQTLLAGLGPTVVGYGLEGAMKFGVYEVMKPVFTALLAPSGEIASSTPTPAALILSSVFAGAVAALILCPMESTRIRIVTDPAYAGKGLLTGLPKLIAEEGFISTFSGLWAMLAKQIPYTFGKQVSFDVFTMLLYSFFEYLQHSNADVTTKWTVSIVGAACASIFACIFSQPGDMILTETYRRPEVARTSATNRLRPRLKPAPPSPPLSTSFFAVTNRIYQRDGLSTFFTGTGARIVHVGLIITSQLVVYDLVKQMLGLPATGAH